jgi:DNA-binding NtrC family response regulator
MAVSTLISQDPPSGDGKGRPPTSLHLIAIGPGLTSSVELGKTAVLLIGRAEEADVRILDPRASRSHARLYVTDGRLSIEDLGSANGTFLRDERIRPGEQVRIEQGEVVGIGSTILMVQRREAGFKARPLWPYAYFETRLIEECGRAGGAHVPFALTRLDLQAGADLRLAEEIIGGALRPGDLLAAYGPSQYVLLFPDSGDPQSRALVARIVSALAEKGMNVRSGLAFFPADGASPQELLARASREVRGPEATGGQGVVLVNRAMRELYALADRVAVGAISVLITGETGSGKEVLAERIHRCSPRGNKPFVALNCAALTESLLESELFGYEKGAFTGAVQAKAGLLEAASGGTLFLDEVGEMSLALQTKMLRVMETRQLLRVGGTKARTTDVRFIAATNRDLEEEVENKTFRRDLFFRLNGVMLTIPPLRDRPDEIEPMARSFLDAAAREMGRPGMDILPEALALMRAYPWPGNIRELRNLMERASLLAAAGPVTLEHLPADKMRRAVERAGALVVASPPARVGEESTAAWRDRVAALERQAIQDALSRCAGNKSRAAELLGMPRTTFFARLKEHGI